MAFHILFEILEEVCQPNESGFMLRNFCFHKGFQIETLVWKGFL